MRKKLALITILLATLGLIAYALLQWKKGDADQNVAETMSGAENSEKQETGEANGDLYVYEDSLGRFSFEYPVSFTAGSLEEGKTGEVILVQKADDAKSAFQIFIIPFDEEGPITPERIRKDIPTMEINEPQEAIVGISKFTALIFKSRDPQIGETREVWFAKNGYLYQVTAPMALDKEIAEMMKTWQTVD